MIMTIPYTKFIYLYPPRAENALPLNKIAALEKKGGWIAQVKKNGQNSVIFVSPEKEVFAMNRHNENHKTWQFPAEAMEIYKRLPGNGWYVLNGELLHNKVRGIRNIHYLHDILVENGQYLLATTYAQRYARLLMLLLGDKRKPEDKKSHFVLDDYTWLARNHPRNFPELFKSLTDPEDEGIVIKKMEGVLATKNNSSWTVKCRIATKNFQN